MVNAPATKSRYYVRVWRGDVNTALLFFGIVPANTAAEAIAWTFTHWRELRNLDGSPCRLGDLAEPDAPSPAFTVCAEPTPRAPLFTAVSSNQALAPAHDNGVDAGAPG